MHTVSSDQPTCILLSVGWLARSYGQRPEIQACTNFILWRRLHFWFASLTCYIYFCDRSLTSDHSLGTNRHEGENLFGLVSHLCIYRIVEEEPKHDLLSWWPHLPTRFYLAIWCFRTKSPRPLMNMCLLYGWVWTGRWYSGLMAEWGLNTGLVAKDCGTYCIYCHLFNQFSLLLSSFHFRL